MSNFTSLTHHIEKLAFQKSDKKAFVFLGDNGVEESVTYYELIAKAQIIGNFIKQKVRPGERVLLLYPQGIHFITAFLGSIYAQVIPVPLPALNNKNLNYILSIASDSGAVNVLTNNITLSRLEILENKNKLRGYFNSATNLFGKLNVNDLNWHATDTIERLPLTNTGFSNIKSSDIAYLQYTSGSTGTPKGVIIDHSNIYHNSQFIKNSFKISESSNLVSWLPMFHDMGLVGSLIAPLYASITTTFLSPISFFKQPVKWLQAISNNRNLGDTTSGGPGFAYDLCFNKVTEEQLSKLDLSNWKQAFIGAEPVKPSSIKNFTEKFSKIGFKNRAFIPVYGLAESTLLVSGTKNSSQPFIKKFCKLSIEKNIVKDSKSLNPNDFQNIVACGNEFGKQKIRIVNPNIGTTCNTNEIGEIWIQGLSAAKGYWKNSTINVLPFFTNLKDEQFFRTGDLGFLNEGHLFITGRIKDLIFLEGRKLHPQDIEYSVTHSHPFLLQHACAAFSVEGQEDKLIVVHEISMKNISIKDLNIVAIRIIDVIKELHQINVDEIIFVAQNCIPKTNSGKIMRQECKSLVQSGLLKNLLTQVYENQFELVNL